MADPKKAGMISGMSPLAVITGDELMEVSSRQSDGTWKTFSILINKIRTNQGLSAYEVAVKNGYQGTEEEWLLTLNGKSAYELAVELGYTGTEPQWLATLVGPSAYDEAVKNGFVGTEAAWLLSLQGKSAFDIAKANGFVGTESQWLASLKGKSAYEIAKEIDPTVGTEAEWLATLVGASAYQVAVEGGFVGSEAAWLDSLKGKSAYQIWVAQGNVGTEADFITSLKGADGDDGASAYEIWEAVPANAGKTEAEFLESLKGKDGTNGTNGDDGASAYDTYKALPGNENKTEAAFIASLKGADGTNGTNGTNGEDGLSAYEVWLAIPGNEGKTQQEFITSLRGTNGTNGTNGEDGKSAYEVWEALPGNAGKTEADFILAIKGADGTNGTNGENGEDGASAYDLWVALPANVGKTEAEFLESLEGKSAYQEWLDLGNTGDTTAFLLSLKGDRGAQGDSAYQVWLSAGNTGSQAVYLASLKGADGENGTDGTDGQNGKPITVLATLTQDEFDQIVSEGTSVSADAYWVGDFIYVYNGTDWVESPNVRGKDGKGLNYLGEWPGNLSLPLGNNYVAGDTYVWGAGDVNKSLWTLVEEPERKWVDIGVPGPKGDSAYQTWLQLPGNTGKTEQEFIDSIKGTKGDTGNIGPDGKSAYQLAVEDGFVGTVEVWLESLNGQSAYQLWLTQPGNAGKTEVEFIASLKGEKGEAAAAFEIIDQLTDEAQLPRPGDPTRAYYVNKDLFVWFTSKDDYENLGSLDGASAYQVWLDLGNTGTAQDFINSLKGTNGTNGQSAYELWEEQAGNVGKTEAEFLASLKGTDGTNGTNGTNGRSAYQLAVTEGFVGTLEEWLDSLQGKNLQVNGTQANAAAIQALPTPENQDAWVANDTGNLWIYATDTWVDAGPFRGADGEDGAAGQSTYALWLTQPGNAGKTEAEFLASLKGTNGTNGIDGRNVTVLGGLSSYGAIVAQPDPAQQDAWTALDTGHLYMYIGTTWTDLGQFKGNPGEQGIQGPPGQGINIVDTVALLADRPLASTLDVGDAVYVEETGSLYQVNDAGVYGVGIPIRGADGPEGPEGKTGPVGPGIQIMGSFATAGELIAAHPTGNPGEAYTVGEDLYLYGVNPVGGATEWYNAGRFKGDKGDTGDAGPRGLKGEKGVKGDRGSLWLTLSSTAAPTPTYGTVGDWAVTTDFVAYYKDEGAGWVRIGPITPGGISSPNIALGKVVREGDSWVTLPVDEVTSPVVDTQYVRKGIAGGKTVWAELVVPATGVPEVPGGTTVPQGRTSAGWVNVIAVPTGQTAGKQYVWLNGAFALSPIQVATAPGTANKVYGYSVDGSGVGSWAEMTFDAYTLLADQTPRTTSFTVNPVTQNCYSVSGTTAGITVTLPKLAAGRSMMCVFTIVGSTNKLSFAAGTGAPTVAYNNNTAAADIEYGSSQTVITAFYNGISTWIISKGPSY